MSQRSFASGFGKAMVVHQVAKGQARFGTGLGSQACKHDHESVMVIAGRTEIQLSPGHTAS